MSTILAYTSPAIGHLYPLMPLLLELRDRGHRVHVRTLRSRLDEVRAAGLEAEPIDDRIEPVLERYPDWEARNAKEALSLAAGLFTDRGILDGPDFARALDEIDPDLALVDSNCWGAQPVAEADGRPWAVFYPYVPPLSSAGTPPFGPGLPRWDNPLGRARDAIVGRLVFQAVVDAFLPRINGLRADAGLGPVASNDEFCLAAPLVLVATSEPFDYPHPDWPEKVVRIGATHWEPDTVAPEWVADLARPLTLVTTSSEYQRDEELARAAIAGLAEEPGSVVVTMPAGVPADLGDLPANVRVERFVPHGHLLRHASVVVTHGGMGATQKALAAGVPVCVVPFGRDQKETAARVVHARAGTLVSTRRLSPSTLRDAVRAAAGMAGGARRCADGFRRAGGAAAAVDAIERSLVGV